MTTWFDIDGAGSTRKLRIAAAAVALGRQVTCRGVPVDLRVHGRRAILSTPQGVLGTVEWDGVVHVHGGVDVKVDCGLAGENEVVFCCRECGSTGVACYQREETDQIGPAHARAEMDLATWPCRVDQAD